MDKQLLENLPTVSLLELSKSLSTKFTQVTVRINSVTVTPIRVTVSYSGGTTHWKSLCILDDGSNTAYLHCEEESTLTILSISKEVQEEILVYCHSKGSFEWSHSHIVNKAQVYNPADAYDEIYNRTLDYLDTVDLCSNSLFIVYAWAMVPHQSAQPTLGNKVSLQAYYVERPNYITETTRMLASLLKDSHS
ncbi:hypothetical protein Pelo_14846 [Pelomyxa schiedti]|nr:hypothetical protein Pelo_14846 [Pelomyxa schiedti]